MLLTTKSIKNLPIPTPIQNHALNINKAAIIISLVSKKFGVMKPSSGCYSIGPTQDNFLSWWQLCMLITGQPDKMLRDMRNSKGSTELSATALWTVVSGDITMF
jgi:hypothetical protein